MNKKMKIVLITLMSLSLVVLISILIYSNFIAKDNSNKNTTNSQENNVNEQDKPFEGEKIINQEYSFDDIAVTDFKMLYDSNKANYLIGFKLTNNTDALLEKFDVMLSLKDSKGKVVLEVPVEILRIDKEQTRYISYITDVDISEATSFSFKKISVKGKGN